ncbi:GNAT family N-acetyltransferase [Kribbella hippodromi]|uniref:GNAT family N-acetyltransferase n=1 Tax=Kribbella hippodromi TaxID=434347 RepID=A0ABP4NW49_9ACTN
MVIDGVEVRSVPAADADVLALAAAQQAELAALYGEDQPLVALHDEIRFIVLTLDGIATGCVGLQPVAPGVGEIKRMYVVPAARGRGLSRVLLDAVEAAARADGLTRLRLETGTKQVEAIALYTHHGYEPIPAYPPFEHEPASVCFAKDL